MRIVFIEDDVERETGKRPIYVDAGSTSFAKLEAAIAS